MNAARTREALEFPLGVSTMKKSSLILAVVVLLASVAFGQTNKGSLTGIVSDKSGAAVADATATAKNLATSEEVKTVSTGQGVFNFPALAPGKYNVTVEAKGFKRVEVTGVSIDVSTPANLTFALEVGDVSEAVVVSGDTQEVVNTSSATLTNVITTRQVEDLPIAGRNPVELEQWADARQGSVNTAGIERHSRQIEVAVICRNGLEIVARCRCEAIVERDLHGTAERSKTSDNKY